MSVTAMLGLALAAGLAASRADAGAKTVAPRLQLTHLTGELLIEPAPERGGGAGSKLPYIRPGSTLRVLSGAATFESDHHAVIRAKEGGAFTFTASSTKAGRPAVVRVAQAAEGDPEALEVVVAAEKFLLAEDGASVSLIPEGSGVVRVAVVGPVQLVTASDAKDADRLEYGDFPDVGIGIPGIGLSVSVPKRTGFSSKPLKLAALRITRPEGGGLLVEGADGTLEAAEAVDQAVAGWPPPARQTASLLMEKYGPPGAASAGELVWNNNGPWNRTVLRPDDRAGLFRRAQGGILQQYVRYELPRGKMAALAELGVGLRWDGDSRELSAASGSEETNFLALNVADAVVNGRLAPDRARAFYDSVLETSRAGRSSPYLEGLMFEQY
ncbi:MAG: hypothetical protein HYZ75_17015 [Elusimicrobia bacterium]|nr:hypothetical protein [Elusimicrobiota bacterium]